MVMGASKGVVVAAAVAVVDCWVGGMVRVAIVAVLPGCCSWKDLMMMVERR